MNISQNFSTLRTLLVAAPLALLLVWIRPWRFTNYNSVVGTVMSFPFIEDTVYAEAYSEAGWRQIKVGMTEEEVRGLIGEPLPPWPNEPQRDPLKYGARWSRSRGDNNYWIRVLHFENHRVVRKVEEFYVD